MSNSINVKEVSEKAIEDVFEHINLEEYEEGETYKSVIEGLLKAVEHKENKGNMQKQVHDLVYGGCFLISNYDILKFLKTLDLNEATMKLAEKEPMEVYANVLWHAIKRYIKWGYKDEEV